VGCSRPPRARALMVTGQERRRAPLEPGRPPTRRPTMPCIQDDCLIRDRYSYAEAWTFADRAKRDPGAQVEYCPVGFDWRALPTSIWRTIALLAGTSPAQASRVLPELAVLGWSRPRAPPSALFRLVDDKSLRVVERSAGARDSSCRAWLNKPRLSSRSRQCHRGRLIRPSRG